MEPADQRRDDATTETWANIATKLPQWSPPTSGGTTSTILAAARTIVEPQWSPPTSGGTTARNI